MMTRVPAMLLSLFFLTACSDGGWQVIGPEGMPKAGAPLVTSIDTVAPDLISAEYVGTITERLYAFGRPPEAPRAEDPVRSFATALSRAGSPETIGLWAQEVNAAGTVNETLVLRIRNPRRGTHRITEASCKDPAGVCLSGAFLRYPLADPAGGETYALTTGVLSIAYYQNGWIAGSFESYAVKRNAAGKETGFLVLGQGSFRARIRPENALGLKF